MLRNLQVLLRLEKDARRQDQSGRDGSLRLDTSTYSVPDLCNQRVLLDRRIPSREPRNVGSQRKRLPLL
jgi:hypothetical protein